MKKLKLEDLGYSCEDLESQQIDNIDKIIIIKTSEKKGKL